MEPIETKSQDSNQEEPPKSNQRAPVTIPKQNLNLRHFKALMRKNAINWRRTICGSILEIICPVLLMFLLVYIRTQVEPYLVGEFDVYQIKKPYYSTATLDPLTGNWSDSNFETTRRGLQLADFMDYTEYLGKVDIQDQSIYEPLLDPLGPYFFFPNHCTSRNNRFASPIIAYVGQDNQIERDMLTQIQMLMQKQKWLHLYVVAFTKALENPTDPSSIEIFAHLFDGGTPEQIIDLLYEFGVSSDVIYALQLVYDIQSAQNGTNPTQNLQLFASQNFTQIRSVVGNISALQLNSELFRQNVVFISDLANRTGLNQTQITELVNFTLIQNNATALQTLLRNNTATSNQQLLNLTSQQQDQLTQLLNNQTQFSNLNISNLTSENATLLDQLVNQFGLTSEQNSTLQDLVNSAQSNQTLQDFLQAQPTNSLASRLGLNQTQAEQISNALQEPNTIFTNQTLRDNLMRQNSTIIEQISSAIGINQTLADQLSTTTSVDQLASTLQLTPNQTQLLLNLTNNQTSIQTLLSDQQSINQVATSLNLDQAQLNQLTIASLLLNGNRTQRMDQIRNSTSQTNLSQAQIYAINNLTGILTGQMTVQEAQTNYNQSLSQLATQLGLTDQQSQTLKDAISVYNTQSLVQQLTALSGVNTTQNIESISQRFGLNQNQTNILTGLIQNQTSMNVANNLSQVGNSSILFDQTQALIQSLAQNQTIPADLVQQISSQLNLNQSQTQQIQDLVGSTDLNSTVQQFGAILGLNQTSIDALNIALVDQQNAFLQGNIQLNGTQISEIQNILNGLSVQSTVNNVQTEDIFWGLSPISKSTAQYLFTVVQNLSNGGNISAILSPELEKFTQSTLGTRKIDMLTEGSEYKQFGKFYTRRFESNEELDAYIQHPNYGWSGEMPGICFGFKVIEHDYHDYEVELMFNDLPPSRYDSIPNQKADGADPTTRYPKIKEYGLYSTNGFSNLQNWFANTILKRKTGMGTAEIVAMIVPVKIPPVYQDNFINLLQLTLTLFILLMYIPAIYRTVYRIVYEKQSRAKESMRMMGMSDLPYWGSWLAYYTIVNTVLTTLCWATLQLGVFNHKSALILFVFIWLYGQSLFGLIMITQSIFTSPRACAITTTVVYFGTSLLEVIVDDSDTPKNKKIAVCWFFPTVTLAQIIKPLVMFDQSTGNTIQSWNLQFQNFSVKEGLILLVIGGINMLVLGLYLEQVMPKTYGNRKHPLFFLGVKSCSCRRRGALAIEHRPSNVSLTQEDQPYNFETKYLKQECFEPADLETRGKEVTNQILKVSDLKKEYENGFKAVNGINLKMYSDQIFVLLGHNGAGKTTTLSMLTGLFGASEGQAEVFGVDIFNDMDRVRQIMGVCPQHDILFELLTAQEHLEFFYDLKGADPDPVKKKAEIDKLMLDVGVNDKKNSLASHLSGGNKRKLSVAIALCGGSKFVLLDEPTSGMDLQARRQLWNMLKECKKDRIVVLTTHYMDEADILGDRIGIMANGKLTCLGTSMFLKNKFGVGYNLTLVKASTESNSGILEYLHQKLGPNVKLQSEIQSEMTIQIPIEYAPMFAEFFKSFDEDLESLKVISYGISISTLEEVFLKVGHLDDPSVAKQSDNPSTQSNQSHGSDDLEVAQNLSDVLDRERRQQAERFNLKDNQKELDETFINNLQAVLFKRVSNYRRNRRAVFNEAILPAIIMLVGVTLTEFYPQWRSPSRILSPHRLPLPQKILFNPIPTVQGDVFVSDLVKGLPEVSSVFDVSYSDWNSTTSMRNFGNQVFERGNKESAFPPYQYGSYQIYEADRSTQQYKFISWVNLTSQDSTGLYPQFMYESILKTATNDPDFKFKVRLTTYPPTEAIKVVAEVANSGTIVFMSAIAYSMIITAIVSYLVVERISGLKHLQVISGMNLKAYWVGNFIFDLIKMELTILVTLALFFGYKMGLTAAWATYIVLPLGIIPFSYVMSFWFTVDSAAQTFTMFFHFFILGIMSTLTFGLRISPDNQHKGDILNWALKSVPTYPIGSSMFCDTACSSMSWQRDNVKGTGGPIDANVWHYSNITADVVVMFIHLLGWSIVLALIETKFFAWCRLRPNIKFDASAQNLDEDVIKEAERVQQVSLDSSGTEIVQVENLKKVYRVQQSKIPCKGTSLLAVSNLSFALQSGECFALLGVNGAGKSTTFKSLTREVDPTSGKVSIGGFDVQKQFMQARKLMGYCPQPNLIFDSMSVEEHIYYYARIKGIPRQHRISMVELSIQKLGLQIHRKKTAGTLSGGNKRKLCVAIALVGNPPIIFLDEPSAGMDPEARRFMWSVVAKIAERKTSAVVLTTHSMEEAEALSTKMGIMVKGGVFKCFGSSQHIKNKFGTGFVIEIKIRTLQLEELDAVCQPLQDSFTNKPKFDSTNFDYSVQKQILDSFTQELQDSDNKRKIHSEISLYKCIGELCKTFTDVQLIEKYGNYIRVKVSRLDRSIGSVFSLLEPLKEQYSVSEYSVSQTTLEQIFQGFADPSFNDSAQTFRLVLTQFGTLPSILDSNSKVIDSDQKPRSLLTIVKSKAQ